LTAAWLQRPKIGLDRGTETIDASAEGGLTMTPAEVGGRSKGIAPASPSVNRDSNKRPERPLMGRRIPYGLHAGWTGRN